MTIAGLGLIIWGYGTARQNQVLLYAPPRWTQYVTAVLMLPVFPLFLAAYFPGSIKRALQHPMLISVMLWAVAHLIATGTLADATLFGGFLAWALADRISYRWRTPRPIPTAPAMRLNDGIAVVTGLAFYVALNNGCTSDGSVCNRCRCNTAYRDGPSSAWSVAPNPASAL